MKVYRTAKLGSTLTHITIDDPKHLQLLIDCLNYADDTWDGDRCEAQDFIIDLIDKLEKERT